MVKKNVKKEVKKDVRKEREPQTAEKSSKLRWWEMTIQAVYDLPERTDSKTDPALPEIVGVELTMHDEVYPVNFEKVSVKRTETGMRIHVFGLQDSPCARKICKDYATGIAADTTKVTLLVKDTEENCIAGQPVPDAYIKEMSLYSGKAWAKIESSVLLHSEVVCLPSDKTDEPGDEADRAKTVDGNADRSAVKGE